MNKPVVFTIIGVVVVAAVLFALKPWDKQPTDQALNNQGSEQENNQTRQSSLRELMGLGENMVCDYQRNDEAASQSGKVYISGNKVRGEFTVSQQDSATYTGYFLTDGEWQYSWGGPMGDKQGIKFKVTEAEAEAATTPDQEKQSVDYDQKMEINCNKWSVDNGLFNPPSDVVFNELTIPTAPVVNPAPGTDNQPASPDCSVCDQVPAGETRDQCRQALGC